jgi:hypothetical protein
MALHYLESLKEPCFLDREREKLRSQCAKIAYATAKVARILKKACVCYAFFKTIRPYREVTVDLDIIIFGPSSQYKKALKALLQTGYALLDGDILSSTFRDITAELNIDIYSEVCVSRLIYVDKTTLEECVVDKSVANEVINCLNQPADLLCLIAHSVIKEQMYVLSEYYTSLYLTEQMSNGDFDILSQLMKEGWLCHTVSTHFTFTAFTHYFVHGVFPSTLLRILKSIDVNYSELSRLRKSHFLMPHKYHFLTFARALLEKSGERKGRNSFAYQTLKMLDPRFTSTAIYRTIGHVFRESY